MLAAWRELHVQDGLAGFQRLHDLAGQCVDHFNPGIIREGVIHPDLPPVGACHDEYRLALDLDSPDLAPVADIDDQHLVATNRRQIGFALRHRPAAQMRHLEHRQLLLPASVIFENLPCALLGLPGIEQRHTVFAEQAGHIETTIGRHQPVVRLHTGRIALRFRVFRVGEIAHPDLAAVKQRVAEAVARQIGQTDYFRKLARRVFGRHFGEQFERIGVKSLDAARRVVLRYDDATILRNRAADRVTGLHHTLDDARFEQIDLGQPAVAAEDESVAPVARIDGRGVREIAEPFNVCIGGTPAGVDKRQLPAGALDDQPKITSATQLRCGAGGQEDNGEED